MSVVVPTRNRCRLLARALRTVLAQTHQNLEILVVDDGSEEDAAGTVAAIGDPRIRFVRLEGSRGGSFARNTGIRLATGRYIAFLDDDDEWEPDKISRQLEMLGTYPAVLCGYHGEESGAARRFRHRPAVGLDELRRGFFRGGGTSALMAESTLIREVRFDESLPRLQDWDVCIRLASRSPIGYVDRPLVRYNDGAHERISNRVRDMDIRAMEAELRMIEKHRAFFGERMYRFHMSRLLLRYIAHRPDRIARLAYVARRYGPISVAAALAERAWRKLGGRRPGPSRSDESPDGEPLVSVVIPTYRRAFLIRTAIEQVRRQTYRNVEIIVVDDGSPDDTGDIVRSVEDPRIRYVRHERNRGLPAARNTGIALAGGRYIAFLDDDDGWVPDKLEKQVRAIAGYDAVLCAALADGHVLRSHRKREVTLDDLKRGSFDPSSLFARAEVLREVGFDETLRQGEDWDAFIRIAQRHAIRWLPEPLLLYNNGTHERMTSEARNMSKAELEGRTAMLQKHREFFGERWYRYHRARTLLSYIGTRTDKGRCLEYAVKCCGIRAVTAVLLAKTGERLRRAAPSLRRAQAASETASDGIS